MNQPLRNRILVDAAAGGETGTGDRRRRRPSYLLRLSGAGAGGNPCVSVASPETVTREDKSSYVASPPRPFLLRLSQLCHRIPPINNSPASNSRRRSISQKNDENDCRIYRGDGDNVMLKQQETWAVLASIVIFSSLSAYRSRTWRSCLFS